MRNSTKRAKRVEQVLYTNFSGSVATRYGMAIEGEALTQYVSYKKKKHGHPNLAVEPVGLCIIVHDPETTPPVGLVEIKNPYLARDMTVQEFETKGSSCLEANEDGSCRLKHGHDYYYQIQCKLYCADKEWCDFIVRTNKDMHIERIVRDRKWWDSQMEKCHKFYFTKKETVMTKSISVEKRLAITLYYLATNSDFRTVGHLFGVSKSFVCLIVQEVCATIVDVLLPKHLSFPSGDALRAVISGFQENHKFPQCVGAVDGCHIPIVSPPDCAADYYNRKGFHSVLLQGTVNHFGLFTDIYVGRPGRVHDARVFSNSILFKKGKQGTLMPN